MKTSELIEKIDNLETEIVGLEEVVVLYFGVRKLVRPNVWKALAFADTERGEAMEVLLAKDNDGWVRNNPDGKPSWDQDLFAEELGDIIMMLIMAGFAEGVFPVTALLEKMKRKLRKEFENDTKVE